VAYLEVDDDLHCAVRRFTAFGVGVLPVLAGPPPARIIGLLSHHRVMEAYDEAVGRVLQNE